MIHRWGWTDGSMGLKSSKSVCKFSILDIFGWIFTRFTIFALTMLDTGYSTAIG